MMGDRGANALEVTGLVITVAGVLVALGFALPEPVTGGFRSAVCRAVTFGDDSSCKSDPVAGDTKQVGGGMWPKGSGVPNPDQPYMPTCLVESASVAMTGDVQVYSIEAGGDLVLVQQTSIDPQTGEPVVTIQALNANTAGLGAGVGGDIGAGVQSTAAEASVSGALGFTAGDGWEFRGPDATLEAADLLDDVAERAAAYGTSGANAMGEWTGDAMDFFGVLPDVPDPTTHTYTGSFEVSAGADVGLQPGYGGGKNGGDSKRKGGDDEGPDGWLGDINADAQVSVDAESQVTYETNDVTGESSVTYMLKGGAGAGANWVVDGANTGAAATGSVKITENADGSIKSATFTQVHLVGDELVETITEVEPRNDAERDELSSMFAMAGQNAALTLTWDDMAPTEEPGEDASDLERLIYETGKTSRVSYDYDSSSDDVGFSGKYGLTFGFQLGTETEKQLASEAEYLGAPGEDGTREFKDYDACESGVRSRAGTNHGGLGENAPVEKED